jgi:tetratricopeptide (TPR) repeat protein
MDDTTPADEQSDRKGNDGSPERKPRSIPPIPVAPNWREEVAALKDVEGELAVSLWRALRRVRLWLDTAPDSREGLFRSPSLRTQEQVVFACMRAPQLIEPFGTFALLVRAPGRIKAARVAEACHFVHAWASGHSLLVTGVHFAEAAATIAPDDPAYANDAGWMCFRAGYNERAETWYLRAYGLAVRLRHHDVTTSRDQSIRALLRLGVLMQSLGRHDAAKELFDRAARRAARTGRRPMAAKASHDLMSYMADLGTYEEAERYASQALDLYALDAPRLPVLAHDYGFLLVRFAQHLEAVPLLQSAVTRILFPEVQTLAWGTLARAAAGAGRRELYQDAKQHTLSQLGLHRDFAPAVFVNLGEGARFMGDWDEAETYAALALEAARERQQPLAESVALELLDQIASRRLARPDESVVNPDQVRLLVRRFLARLRKWKAPNSIEPGAHPSHGDGAAGADV